MCWVTKGKKDKGNTRWDQRSCKTMRWDRDGSTTDLDVQPRQHNTTLMYYTDEYQPELHLKRNQGRHTRHQHTNTRWRDGTHVHDTMIGWGTYEPPATTYHDILVFFFPIREAHITTNIFCIVLFFFTNWVIIPSFLCFLIILPGSNHHNENHMFRNFFFVQWTIIPIFFVCYFSSRSSWKQHKTNHFLTLIFMEKITYFLFGDFGFFVSFSCVRHIIPHQSFVFCFFFLSYHLFLNFGCFFQRDITI